MKTLLALVVLSAPAMAQEFQADGEVRTVAHEVAVEIHDRVAATTVTQVFENVGSRQREGTYTFAVPPGASIVEFQMWIGTHIMKGEMIERKKADEVYRAIVNKRVDPGILDHVRDNIWRVRVFPIPPQGGEMKFLTRYVELLPFAAGQATYTLPFSIPEDRVRKMDRFSIDIKVHTPRPVTKVEAPGMAVTRRSATEFIASADRANVTFQQDLVVRYEAKADGADLGLVAHRPRNEDGYFLFSLTPDLSNVTADRVPREVVYLLDASGSIDEKVCRRAAGAIAEGLRDLGPRDRFNIVTFNTSVQKFQDSSVDATPANLKAAAAFLEKIRPEGRTDLDAALQAALALKADRARVVLVISDGLPSAGRLADREIVARALEKIDSNTVIFTVPMGEQTGRALETLAAKTGGECLPAQENGFEKALRALQKRLSRPVLTDVAIDFGGASAHALRSPRMLFADEPFLVAGRYRTGGTHEVTVKGKLGDREVKFTRAFEFPEKHDGWRAAAYVWAGREIEALLADVFLLGESPALVETISALSREHRIATPYTAFLVLENDEMYGQYGLERTIALEKPLFAPKRGNKKSKAGGDGSLGLPDLTGVKPVDPLGASADPSLVPALRWLCDHAKDFKGYTSGAFELSGTGVRALALHALEAGDFYALNEEDRRRFEETLRSLIEDLRKAQRSDGRIGETLLDHVTAAESLGLLLRWHPDLPGTREILQRAVSWLSDQPGLYDRKGAAAMAAPALALARDLRIEVDAATLKAVESGLDASSDALYVRARMTLDPKAVRDDRVISAVRRMLEKGPTDPVTAYFASEALLAWKGDGSPEWAGWSKRLEGFRRADTHQGSWLPRGWKEDGRGAATALRALLLQARDRRKD